MMGTPEVDWQPDDASDFCTGCGSQFSFTNRRHHCRQCGKLMCNDCTNKRWDFHGKFWGQRICAACRYELCVLKEVSPSEDKDEEVDPEPSAEELKMRLQLREERIEELEEVVGSVSFAAGQATRQRDLLLRRMAKMGRRMDEIQEESVASIQLEHQCSPDTEVSFESGPMGLSLTDAPTGSEYSRQLEGFAKLETGEPGPAELFNKRMQEEGACCGLLRKGMLLVAINGKTTSGMNEELIKTALRNATRPATLTFRDTTFSKLKRKYNELQTRFSILSVQADLNRGTLKDTAEEAIAKVDEANKLIALMAKRFKHMRRELGATTTQLDDARVEIQQLRQLRGDLEQRLAYATRGAMSATKSQESRLTARAEAIAKAKDAELMVAQQTISGKDQTIRMLNKEKEATAIQIKQMKRELSQLNDQNMALLEQIEKMEKQEERKQRPEPKEEQRSLYSSATQSQAPGEDTRVLSAGLWKLYRTEQQRRTTAEDARDSLMQRQRELEHDKAVLKAQLFYMERVGEPPIDFQSRPSSKSRRGKGRRKSSAASHRINAARRELERARSARTQMILPPTAEQHGISLFRKAAHEVEDVSRLRHRESSSDSDSDDSADELASIARRLQAAVTVKDRRYRLKNFKQCFVGSEAVKWLVSSKMAKNVESAVNLGNDLLLRGYIQHVTMEHNFENKQLFYRFVEPSNNAAGFPDSDSDSDSSSSDSDSAGSQSSVEEASAPAAPAMSTSGSYDARSLELAEKALSMAEDAPMVLGMNMQKASKEDRKSMTKWKRRYVSVTSGVLSYFASESDMRPKGEVPLRQVTGLHALTVQQIKKPFTFRVDVPGKQYFFQAANNAERGEWMALLGACLFRVKEMRREAERAAKREEDGGESSSSSDDDDDDDDDDSDDSSSSDSDDDRNAAPLGIGRGE